MYELVIENNGVVIPVFRDENERVVELMRQRHARSLTPGEARIIKVEPKESDK